MADKFTIEMVEAGAPRGFKKQFNQIKKIELQNTVQFWHENYLDDHFKKYSGAKYHYRKRSARYLKSKQKKVGHKIPNVLKGDLRRQANAGIRISGTTKGAIGRMRVPRYAYVQASPKHPRIHEELIRTISSQETKMALTLKNGIVEELNKV